MEHGDEANILKPGGNYGWPYKNDGQGTSVQTLPAPAGVELTSAYISWDPQRRVSGMAFYTGDRFPKWKNNLFLGTLNNEQIQRVVLEKPGRRCARTYLRAPVCRFEMYGRARMA